MVKATVIVDDEFLKTWCHLSKGSKVKVLQKVGSGRHYDCQTMEGKYVRLKATEIKIRKQRRRT